MSLWPKCECIGRYNQKLVPYYSIVKISKIAVFGAKQQVQFKKTKIMAKMSTRMTKMITTKHAQHVNS